MKRLDVEIKKRSAICMMTRNGGLLAGYIPEEEREDVHERAMRDLAIFTAIDKAIRKGYRK